MKDALMLLGGLSPLLLIALALQGFLVMQKNEEIRHLKRQAHRERLNLQKQLKLYETERIQQGEHDVPNRGRDANPASGKHQF
jgi:hypothetical protein